MQCDCPTCIQNELDERMEERNRPRARQRRRRGRPVPPAQAPKVPSRDREPSKVPNARQRRSDDDDFPVALPQQTLPATKRRAADDRDDDEIIALEDAPEHLRRIDNRDNPIMVLSDDDDEEDYPVAGPSGTRALFLPGDSDEEDNSGYGQAAKRARINQSPEVKVVGVQLGGSAAVASTSIVPKSDYLVPLVLNIIPDLDTEWAVERLDALIDALKEGNSAPGQAAVNQVIEEAFDMEGGYPKVGDAAVAEPEEEGDYTEPMYRADHRRGAEYDFQANRTLESIFPRIPSSHIREMYNLECGRKLVPTYLFLHRQSTLENKPYVELKRSRGKARALEPFVSLAGEDAARSGASEIIKEGDFLRGLIAANVAKETLELENRRAKESEEAEKKKRQEDAIANGSALECGCCFDSYAPVDIVECEEGHHFCGDCVIEFANSQLGQQSTTMKCMASTSSCTGEYTESTLRKILPEKTMSLFYRIRQAADLEAAHIDGLESCPYCPFAMVIDNPEERLFRCLNDECKKVTCRQCRKPDHLPKRCSEAAADSKLDKRHAIEEAMSAALVRRCPTCNQPFIKEAGCNKMVCRCGAMCCYICGKHIKGYDHFNHNHLGMQDTPQPGVCYLWTRDETEANNERIRQARDKAEREVRERAEAEGIELDDTDVNIHVPDRAAPVRPRPTAPGLPPRPAFPGHHLPPNFPPFRPDHIAPNEDIRQQPAGARPGRLPPRWVPAPPAPLPPRDPRFPPPRIPPPRARPAPAVPLTRRQRIEQRDAEINRILGRDYHRG